MERDQIESSVKKIVGDYFELDCDRFMPNAIIAQTLDLNSLTRMELIVLIRENLGIVIPPKDFVSIVTFADLYNCIYEHQPK